MKTQTVGNSKHLIDKTMGKSKCLNSFRLVVRVFVFFTSLYILTKTLTERKKCKNTFEEHLQEKHMFIS